MTKHRDGVIDVALAVLLLCAVWFTRAQDANRFVSWDEPAWAYRSARFLTAVQSGHLADTLQTGHPGVLSMWSGAAGLWLSSLRGSISPVQIATVAAWPSLDVHNPEQLRHLVAILPACKMPLPLVHALVVTGIYLLLRRSVGRLPALLASGLLLIDPFFIGLARLLHIDALSAEMMLLALAGALAHCQEPDRRWPVWLAGAAAGLAALAKAYGVLVAPVALVVMGQAAVAAEPRSESADRRSAGRRMLWPLLRWGGGALLGFVLLWPAMWVAPMGTLSQMVGLSLEYATAAGDATAGFFRGEITRQVGLLFYPTVIWFRCLPVTVIALLGGGAWGLARLRHKTRWRLDAGKRRAVWAGLLFALLYLAVMSTGSKKFDRYAIPAILAMDMAAGVLLGAAIEQLVRRFPRHELFSAALGLAVIMVQCFWTVATCDATYPIAYYSPLAGGPQRARQVLPMGWGEGIDLASDWMAAQRNASDRTTATWAISGLVATWPGQLVPLTAEKLPLADQVLLYLGDAQSPSELAKRYLDSEPVATFCVNEVPYAWVYPVGLAVEVMDTLLGMGLERDERVILSRESRVSDLLQAAGHGPLVLDEQFGDELRQALAQSGLAPRSQVVYVGYSPEREGAAQVRTLLAANGYLLDTVPFSLGTIYRYSLVAKPQWLREPALDAVSYRFGESAELVGLGLLHDQIAYRQDLAVETAWELLDPAAEDLHLFLHFVDANGRRWGQRDLPLRDLAVSYEDGESLIDEPLEGLELLVLAPGIPPGSYWLDLGLYTLADLARLPVSANGQALGNSVRLGPITVEPPPYPATMSEMGIARHVSTVWPGIELLGTSELSSELVAGDSLGFDLYWRLGGPLDPELLVSIELIDASRLPAAVWQVQPVPGYSSCEWSAGQTVRGVLDLTIPDDVAPGDYALVMGVEGSPTQVDLGNLRVTRIEHAFQAPVPQTQTDAMLGDWCRLVGYDIEPPRLAAGEVVSLTLYWQAVETTERSWTVFTHLLDSKGQVKAQQDSVPLDGARPTSSWLGGEYLVDHYELRIDPGATTGWADIEIGMYDAASGERERVVLGDGTEDPNGRVLLDRVLKIG